jgi:hypothetical protein
MRRNFIHRNTATGANDMATFTINTRKHGEVTFRVRDEGGYVRVTGAKWDYKQICDGGCFNGNTIAANEKTLEVKARKWWSDFLAAERQFA